MGRAFQNRKESMAKTAAVKTKVYGKYGREIYVVAKQGGIDPNGNLALRSLIERAKKDQVPTHVIQKALDKASGGGGEDFSAARYEGFGPAGSMVIVECLTDNPNRTYSEVRQCFVKSKCKIGVEGTCAHMFDHVAVFVFDGEDEEGVLEALMMADIDVTDVECEDGKITVFAPTTEFAKTRSALVEHLGESADFDVEEIQFVPQTTTAITGEDVETFEKLLDLLNDQDDVQRVYHNAEL